MTTMSETLKVKNITFKNRLFRSAAWEGLANDEGLVTPELQAHLVNLAKGGTALVTAGFASVSPDGVAVKRQLQLAADEVIPGLKELGAEVSATGSLLAVQLAHGGANSVASRINKVGYGPSDIFDGQLKINTKALSIWEIKKIIDDFAAAAVRAKKAGVDVIQLHAAHGYLLSQFLSPLYNQRGDQYGGKPLNRARLLIEIYEAIRGSIGDEQVISVKINGEDYLKNGLTADDSRKAALELTALGLDMVEVSGGLPQSGPLGPIRPKPETEADEAPFAKIAAFYKEAIKAPVYVVGTIRSPETAIKILADKKADALSLARPLIREPNLPNNWLAGDLKKSTCISCNACFKVALKNEGLYCPVK